MADNIDFQQMTKDFEGFRPTPYLDTQGVPTIGYGFNMNAGSYPPIMSREEADKIFSTLYGKARNRATAYVGQPVFNTLTPMRQAILTDMAYNLGNKLEQFKQLRKAIISNDPAAARREMQNSSWYGQVGNRSRHHVNNW